MAEKWIDICLRAGDLLFGSLLARSWLLTLAALALISAVLMTLIRRLVTDQDLLASIRADLLILRGRRREARATGDRDALQRIRQVEARISMSRIVQEARALVVTVIPIAILATWGYARLTFAPLPENVPVKLRFAATADNVGELVYVVSDCLPGPEQGSVRRLEPGASSGRTVASAEWTLPGVSAPCEGTVTIVLRDQRISHPVLAGGAFAGRIRTATDEGAIEIAHDYRGMPGFLTERLSADAKWPEVFPIWLVLYLVIAIPSAGIMRKQMGVS